MHPTSNINISFTGFDFNKTDMAFVRHQFEGVQSPAVAKLADDLRWWGMECSANKNHVVAYELNAEKHNGLLVHGVENILIAPVQENPHTDLSATLVTSGDPQAYRGPLAAKLANGQGGLDVFDLAYAAMKGSIPATHLNNYHSLRNLIRQASTLATEVYAQPSSLIFVWSDNGKFSIFKVFLGHLPIGSYLPAGTFHSA